jgi:two-component system, chemotaxis family, protein-glutamate methylesterase/glutaminase
MAVERVVVIGASAGGVAALELLVGGLPADFPAAVLIVLHIAATQKSLLAGILSRAGPLRAAPAMDGAPLRAGHIYVAVADHHLMVERDRIKVTRGPKENHFRPSIDVLFRSAAYYFGARAIGVVMSGALSDGSSGLFAIKRLGGLAVIQDPDEALYSSMPLSALSRVDVDYGLPAAEIGALLSGLTKQPPPRSEPLDAAHYRKDLKADVDIAAADSAFERGIMEYAKPSAYTCPECHGVLFRIEEGKHDRFRCHTGHGFTTAALLDGCTVSVEATLWEAVKSLQETVALLNESAQKLRENGDEAGSDALQQQAVEAKSRLSTLRVFALDHAALNADVEETE